MLMRQRMARANMQQQQQQQIQQQRQPMQQNMPTPPSMQTTPVRPPPPGALRAPPRMTANTTIPKGSDPVNRYKNLKKEAATGDADDVKGDIMLGVNKLVVGVLSAVAFSAIFVLPRQLQVFWVLVIGLTILLAMGLQLYKELMTMSKGGGENAKYAEWAWVLLFSLVMLFTGVMVGILFFMAWSLYTIANSKTNIARNDAAVLSDDEHREHRSKRKDKRSKYYSEPVYA